MKKLKHCLALILAAALICPHASAAGLRLMLNGRYITPEFAPVTENDLTYLAVRTAADIVGAQEVIWNGDERSVTMLHDGAALKLTIGSEYAEADGAALNTGAAPIIHNERAYLPLRFVAEAFGAKVGWDAPSRTVIIFTNIADEESYTELDWLARIVYAEAGSEPYEGKLAVANVVLNRVKSSSFADTVRGVIFEQNNGIYQFTPAKNCFIYSEPNAESISAAEAALAGENNIEDCLYFVGAQSAESSWAAGNCVFFDQIGNHCFYR